MASKISCTASAGKMTRDLMNRFWSGISTPYFRMSGVQIRMRTLMNLIQALDGNQRVEFRIFTDQLLICLTVIWHSMANASLSSLVGYG